MKLNRFALIAAGLVLLPLAAHAQNNTAGTTSRIAPNTTLYTSTDDTTNAQRWYRFGVVANRSYCVESSHPETLQPSNSAGNTNNDSILTLFSDAAGTAVDVSNDDNSVEPTMQGGGASFGLSRVCTIVTTSGTRQALLTDNSTGTMNWKLKFTDTTIFSPWFFSGSSFEAFILMKNTTSSATNVRVILVATDGSVLGTPQTGTVPANGSLNLLVSAAPPNGFGLASASGGVIITHNGPPGGIFANVTSISFSGGTSFDTPASPRQDWRE